MAMKLTKEEAMPAPGKLESLTLQHQLVRCLSNSFYIRNLVSKQRRRMLVAGYDLDMSYITDRILAMSFRAERMRAMYRNNLWQVKSVLDMRHPEHYKIYNLCIEEHYSPSHFYGRVERYPFDDNHVPPLEMVKLFCESVQSWLKSDPENIAVIHCMAGKGRTGLMVSAYLVYRGMSAEEALQLYAHRRTTNNEGVSHVTLGIPEAFSGEPCSLEA
ncbi:phosphatidylinositol 3,4,5-trisphosphate 3-phosphatase and protein-tyrosine-phosphatase PTEN1-like [Rosa chinensis]|uniref:phosphatidylinositol 3,4,5-trisphosphate 3-phosphatase and protein-tyrosine-phosphatase PTEN1-like n=1 Tax=Rosa chinensis TaxID=74649 RepID=UPI001AD903A8|nr:phosphatidylinositol 3,4,5-trisphosphate 3-phosphatase and protein-tyrosine-phosphatase PTEN1-like [Rosa chinensis]